MRRYSRMTVRGGDANQPPLEIGILGVAEAIAADPPLITPGWRFLQNGRWPPLSEHLHRPWLDELLRRAQTALRAGDPDRAEFLCRRVLEHARPDDDHDAVAGAHFVVAYLQAATENWLAAAERLRGITAGPRLMQAAVNNNLAYVYCMLREPLQAYERWRMALAQQPDFAPAWLSLRNLADLMLQEGAATVAGSPRWTDLRREAAETLARLQRHQLRPWLDDDPPFPGWESVLVLPTLPHLPGLSAHLPPDNTGESAGRHLLDAATAALQAGRCHVAEVLAARARAEDPALAAAAEGVAREAGKRLATGQRRTAAERFQRRLDRFDEELHDLSLSDLLTPLRTLAFLRSETADAAVLEGCERRYRERVCERLLEAVDAGCTDEAQARYLELAACYAEAPGAAVLQAVAAQQRGRPALQTFYQALLAGDYAAARQALDHGRRLTSAAVADAERLLQILVSKEPRTRAMQPCRPM
jgi:hypothetical protein